MVGGKHWILILTELTLLCVVVVTVNEENQRRINVLRELSSKFREFRYRSQYGVLYMPPPNSPSSVVYNPDNPSLIFNNQNRGILYPSFPSRNLPAQFQHNYAAANPDYRGNVYGIALHRPGTSTIHTEDLLLNMVFERMLEWYKKYYGQDPSAIYLFTHFIPCPECTTIIQNALTTTLVDTNGNIIPLYVGFSQLLGGVPNENRNEARNRMNNLRNILNNRNGRLFDIGRTVPGTSTAACTEWGIPRRPKRQAQTTGECSEDEFFFLRMDFTTGKVQVVWDLPNINLGSYAWVGLYDKTGTRKTSEYLSKEKAGIKTFNYYMSDGIEARLSDSYRENIVRTSYPWNNCGFGWRKMNKLPVSYGDVYMALTVANGYPKVGIAFCKGRGVANKHDYVITQNFDQAFANKYQGYQWISELSTAYTHIYKYTYGEKSVNVWGIPSEIRV
ncbi:uncharacterized protein LOC117337876 [Pecten maximus]|uniref:uncharacterized protein LOC117337876 n=1 Tax=Pecten maximus TaxID=6579 RepID=UPI00145905F5|nr:uncharacterized protein LOC117337876 [Pecten maximus]XP_033754904.1 uncharacterized protein LOC117337876 [Pecten maximus]